MEVEECRMHIGCGRRSGCCTNDANEKEDCRVYARFRNEVKDVVWSNRVLDKLSHRR